VAGYHPDLVFEDVGRRFVPGSPDVGSLELVPSPAIFGVPDVAVIVRRIVGPSAQDPDMSPMGDGREPESRVPGGVFGDEFPVLPIRR